VDPTIKTIIGGVAIFAALLAWQTGVAPAVQFTKQAGSVAGTTAGAMVQGGAAAITSFNSTGATTGAGAAAPPATKAPPKKAPPKKAGP
jgi:hypothetical protein